MCPHTTLCPHTIIQNLSLILLYMCPHATIHVSFLIRIPAPQEVGGVVSRDVPVKVARGPGITPADTGGNYGLKKKGGLLNYVLNSFILAGEEVHRRARASTSVLVCCS